MHAIPSPRSMRDAPAFFSTTPCARFALATLHVRGGSTTGRYSSEATSKNSEPSLRCQDVTPLDSICSKTGGILCPRLPRCDSSHIPTSPAEFSSRIPPLGPGLDRPPTRLESSPQQIHLASPFPAKEFSVASRADTPMNPNRERVAPLYHRHRAVFYRNL